MQSDLLSPSEFLTHEPCPQCGSSDALARYTDGHAHCFSCGAYQHGDSDSIHVQSHKPLKLTMDFTGDFVPLKGRNLREDTLKKFNVRYDHDTKTIRFPYYSQAGQLVGFKSRDTDKDFRWTGKNEDHALFGQQLWGRGKEIVITEGELDCLSVYQIVPTWPVVSLPNGAQAAKKALQHQLKWLMGFESIVLFFDSDGRDNKQHKTVPVCFPMINYSLLGLIPTKMPTRH
jgi:twinkle protein